LERPPAEFDEPPPRPPSPEVAETPGEPAAAEALRKWLQRRPAADIDDNGAA
jgi:hypothetical protein